MKGIQRTFKLKDDKIAELKDYLGASLAQIMMSESSKFCSMSSEKYVKAAVANVEEKLVKYEKNFRAVAILLLSPDIGPRWTIHVN